MNFLKRAAFVLGGIFLGINLINYFVLGHTGDYLPGGERMGEWKEAKIREACYPALEAPERDALAAKAFDQRASCRLARSQPGERDDGGAELLSRHPSERDLRAE